MFNKLVLIFYLKRKRILVSPFDGSKVPQLHEPNILENFGIIAFSFFALMVLLISIGTCIYCKRKSRWRWNVELECEEFRCWVMFQAGKEETSWWSLHRMASTTRRRFSWIGVTSPAAMSVVDCGKTKTMSILYTQNNRTQVWPLWWGGQWNWHEGWGGFDLDIFDSMFHSFLRWVCFRGTLWSEVRWSPLATLQTPARNSTMTHLEATSLQSMCALNDIIWLKNNLGKVSRRSELSMQSCVRWASLE